MLKKTSLLFLSSQSISTKEQMFTLYGLFRNDQQPYFASHNTTKARSDRSMKWFTAMLFAVMLTPLARAAQHDEWALVAHGERSKEAYLALRTITQEIELIPVESLNQCEKIGSEIMQGGKLSKFLKGYKCIPRLIY